MRSSEEMLKMVNERLASMTYDRKPYSLYEPVEYVLSLGGKRVRPVLMLMGYEMYKPDPEKIIDVAIGLETYHNFTLLHDDLMDNADVRRGKPTVHKRWDSNTAILSGDTMLVMAYCNIAKAPKDCAQEIMSLFNETALQISEGQQYDMEFELRDDVTEQEYIEMIRLKTSVLLACALKMGAIMAGAPADDADKFYLIGERIGLAFQLQDDYLDVFGDPDVFGKAIGGDIMENKKTFMLINALLKSSPSQRQELERWLSAKNPVAEDKIAAVTRIYKEIGVDVMAQDRIKKYFDEAEMLIAEVNLPDERKTELRRMAAQMLMRNY